MTSSRTFVSSSILVPRGVEDVAQQQTEHVAVAPRSPRREVPVDEMVRRGVLVEGVNIVSVVIVSHQQAREQGQPPRNAQYLLTFSIFKRLSNVSVSDRQLGPIDGKTSIVVPIVASNSYLVDPASSHMLVSKIKPCMSKYKPH